MFALDDLKFQNVTSIIMLEELARLWQNMIRETQYSVLLYLPD